MENMGADKLTYIFYHLQNFLINEITNSIKMKK